jgi:hypothetical protein
MATHALKLWLSQVRNTGLAARGYGVTVTHVTAGARILLGKPILPTQLPQYWDQRFEVPDFEPTDTIEFVCSVLLPTSEIPVILGKAILAWADVDSTEYRQQMQRLETAAREDGREALMPEAAHHLLVTLVIENPRLPGCMLDVDVVVDM